MNSEERIFRALERIEAKQGEHTERLAVVETKLDEVRKEASDDRQTIKDQGETLHQMKGVVKAVGWVGTVGGLSGLGAGLKALLGIGAQ